MMKRTGTPVAITPTTLFYAVEGIDGAGKSLFCLELSTLLNCVLTREPSLPGANPFADILAENRVGNSLSAVEQYYLFQLDRAWHVREVLSPQLEKGIVMTDRYFLSTMAYQFDPKEYTWEDWVSLVESDAQRLGYPNPLPIVIDMDPERALERIRQTRGQVDDFETIDRLERYRGYYLDLAKRYEAIVLDGSLEVFDKIDQLVLKCTEHSDPRARYLANQLR